MNKSQNNKEIKKDIIKTLDNLEFGLSIFFIVISMLNLYILNELIQNDSLFKIVTLISSAIIIAIGIFLQNYIEKKKRM